MLTEKEQRELNELRHDSELLKGKIDMMEADIDDAIYAINCLNKWKKGRWVGFFVSLLVTIVCFGIEVFYLIIQGNAFPSQRITKNDAIEFAVSTTVLSFFTVLLFVMVIVTIVIGFRVMMELGNSNMSRKLASSHMIKNYYNHIEGHLEKKNLLQKELFELKTQKKEIDRRLKELEKNETPWDFAKDL